MDLSQTHNASTSKAKRKNFLWTLKPEWIAGLLHIMSEYVDVNLRSAQGFKESVYQSAAQKMRENFGIEVTAEQCKNQVRHQRTVWAHIQKLKNKSGVSWDDNKKMIMMGQEEYSSHIQVQRKHVYNLRQLILTGDSENCRQQIFQYMQAVVDEIVLGNADPKKHPSNWNLGKLFREFIQIGGEILNEYFAEIKEEDVLSSLERVHGVNSIEVDTFSLPKLPVPPNDFTGIRKKVSSLRRWFAICADDAAKKGRYHVTANLLRKYLSDFLIASYLELVHESGFDETYIQEVEREVMLKSLDRFWRDHLINMNRLSSAVNVRSFGHRNPLEEYKIDGCRFFISMLSATRRLTVESLLHYWSSSVESEELATP